jgi:hypothetical protein
LVGGKRVELEEEKAEAEAGRQKAKACSCTLGECTLLRRESRNALCPIYIDGHSSYVIHKGSFAVLSLPAIRTVHHHHHTYTAAVVVVDVVASSSSKILCADAEGTLRYACAE